MNINVEESRIFVTKSRAPFMICVEMYRPSEEKANAKWYRNVKEIIRAAD